MLKLLLEDSIMMAGFGFAEMLILAVLSGGSGSTDLVAFVQPQHYFQSKGIELSAGRAVELARTEPKDGKSQIMQLTALRYLYDETEAMKKSPNYDAHRKAIEEIAHGKEAQDALGFAKEYATRVLMKLDGKKAEPIKLPPIREEALNWFPAHAKLLFAFDFRQAQSIAPAQDPLKEILKLIPDNVKKEMYTHIERSGNVRMERVAFAFTENAANRNDHKIYLRFTGKANQTWAADALKSLDPQFEITQAKDGKDTPMILIQQPNRPPLMAMIGNTEMLMVGYGGNMGKHKDLLDEVLAVRDKKQPNATAGVFKDRLKKIPDKAVALFLADSSNDMKQIFQQLAKAAPNRIVAHIERMPQGLDLQIESSMANKDDAGTAVQKIGEMRKEGIAFLQHMMERPPQPGSPAIPFQSLINLVASLQVQGEGETVLTRVFLPDGLLQQMGSMGMMFGGFARPIAPPPPK
jgi:hypothetical protein